MAADEVQCEICGQSIAKDIATEHVAACRERDGIHMIISHILHRSMAWSVYLCMIL
jgi:hypothetical protein